MPSACSLANELEVASVELKLLKADFIQSESSSNSILNVPAVLSFLPLTLPRLSQTFQFLLSTQYYNAFHDT